MEGTADEQPCEVRLYWNCKVDDDGLILDFSSVVRTPEWVCEPELVLRTELGDQQCLPTAHRNAQPTRILMGTDDTVRAALMVIPSDLQAVAIGERAVELSLLGEPLEKGVIRTARVRLLCGTALDEERIQTHWESFLNSPLPLTP